MAKSALMDDEAWAQTFVTVTPQEDGFLREIDESSVVSGAIKEQLHLDTWNIVSRRPLMNGQDFINPQDLEKSERVSSDAQTYLQGVPRVELPQVYRDEATQTLYIGRDGPGTDAMKAFDDIITVMNEKPLPEWKKTQMVQTIITFERDTSQDDIVKVLQMDTNLKKELINTNEKNGMIEATDILNFMMDRTFWMSEVIASPTREIKDAETITMMKYNHVTKKLSFDHEAQTSLSCEPKYSNSMLLYEYNRTKCICQSQIEDCMEKGVYSRIIVDNVIEEIIEKSRRQIDFPIIEKLKTDCEENVRPTEKKASIYRYSRRPTLNINSRRTENILLTDNPPYVMRTPSIAEKDPFLKPGCSSNMDKATTIHVALSSTSSESSEESSYTPSEQNVLSDRKTSLKSRDKEALDILKRTFCRSEKCSERKKSTKLMPLSRGRAMLLDELPMLRSRYSPGWGNSRDIERDSVVPKSSKDSPHHTDEPYKDL